MVAIIQWTSIVLSWIAIAINIFGVARSYALHKQLKKLIKDLQEKD